LQAHTNQRLNQRLAKELTPLQRTLANAKKQNKFVLRGYSSAK